VNPEPLPDPPPATDDIDFDILPGLVGYHLRRAQVAVFAHFADSIAGQATPGQFGVLTLIGANPGLTQSALARAVGIERSTMVAVIDGLEDRGFVERRPSPVDRRSYALVLSPPGEALLADLKVRVQAHDDKATANLDAAEKATLMALLRRLADDR
jgi:DNA-binding MarR family transcriptional regulator